MFRKTAGFARFMVWNGILTIGTTFIIVLVIRATLGGANTEWQRYIPTFLFVLMITTLFFFLIYSQGRRLRSEQEQLANMFKHTTYGVMVLDSEMNIIRMNQAAQAILKLDDQSAISNFCGMCSNYPGLNKLCSYQHCFTHDSISQPTELQLVTPDGEPKSVNASVSHYIDPVHGRLSILRMQEVEESRLDEQHQIAKMITHSILSAQENERKRISRELHDGIGQSLYSILIQTEMIKQHLEDEMMGTDGADSGNAVDDHLDALQEGIRNTIEDIRDLSAELRPAALDDIGLVAALRIYFRAYGQKFGIQVHFKVNGDSSRMPATQETAFYRIVQEALTNAAKYAHTDVVDVQLKLAPAEAWLSIRDYGVGFEITPELRKGVGLYSMEERVNILGGTFNIQSAPGEGTSIHVWVPLDGCDRSDTEEG
ncbi:histidine kinase [Paenibacillus melissococcoides]|uniref:histidine kinase n=1 Tax=Paenibacillus melissococcoides TaxID=2912268 RepID=A0ABM9G6B6_9BACL|nr:MULTISPECIES: histidine kinase [Paenibacillus]MEB9892138.1 histidine kinase [Bacillus cereus]CAH8246748.1 histidine kinase [Paenibacillus melissococcoides]CAH8715637.1 histidine kinase [Paenibacillus melissococcoides]CAH8716596.1 histidine kinase [Paenibacillus melissococcoides]GIO77070.1 sensor histidine kinase [Paenibacillus dendritiformis]